MDTTIPNGFQDMEVPAGLTMPNRTRTSNAPQLSGNMNERPASCALCRRRKVKCDKTFPCGSCMRAGVDCVPAARSRLPRGRQGGRKVKSEGALIERIAKLEGLIKDIETQEGRPSRVDNARRPSKADSTHPSCQKSTSATSATPEALERYIGSSFWVSLTEQISGLKDVLDDSSNEEDAEKDDDSTPNISDVYVQPQMNHSGFIFPTKLSTKDLIHPTRHQIYTLCEVYLANVDPVFKVLHAPSLRQYLQEGSDELQCSPGRRGLEPLRFAIYFAATLSLSDGECQHRLGAAKNSLLHNYRSATENALAEADFVNTVEMSTLQALAIYLVAVRSHDSSRLMWTLVSLAVRIAQGMGLNLEQRGSPDGLFHQEMRRRLWWQICILDLHAADDRALNPIISWDSFNTRLPLGVNDAELYPDSSESVHDQERYTDMTFCLMCHEIFETTRHLNYVPTRQLTLAHASYQDNWKERNNTVVDLQRRMEQKYMRHLNLTVPFHWAARLVGDLIMANMWLWIYRPLQRRPSSTDAPQLPDPGILRLAVEVLEKAHRLQIDPAASNIRWVSQTYVQWHALAVVAAELCVKTEGAIVERGWVIIEPAFTQIGQHIADSSKGMLWLPIKKLIKKAKKVREIHLNLNLPTSTITTPTTALNIPMGGPIPLSDDDQTYGSYGYRQSNLSSSVQLESSQSSLVNLPTDSFDWSTWLTAATSEQSQYNSEMDQMAWMNWEDFVGGFQL